MSPAGQRHLRQDRQRRRQQRIGVHERAYLATWLAHRTPPERLWRAITAAAFGQFPDWEPALDESPYRDILDVYDRAGVSAARAG